MGYELKENDMSQYVTDLQALGETLTKEGSPVSASICINGAKRMKRMEDLLTTMKPVLEEIANVNHTE